MPLAYSVRLFNFYITTSCHRRSHWKQHRSFSEINVHYGYAIE